MRIVSPFHDYYDVIQGQGQDLTLVYPRIPEEVPVGYCAPRRAFQVVAERGEETKTEKKERIPSFPSVPHSSRWFRHGKLSADTYVVGFCGKIYPVIKLAVWVPGQDAEAFCFNLEQVDKFIEANFHKREVESYHKFSRRVKGYWNRRNAWRNEVSRATFQKCFEEFAEKQDAYADFFERKKCPIFVRDYRQGIITYHACLRELEFYRLIEPYIAFQELSMCWGGMAQPNRPIPEVTDKDMVTAKGFDKYSFRKEKSKK